MLCVYLVIGAQDSMTKYKTSIPRHKHNSTIVSCPVDLSLHCYINHAMNSKTFYVTADHIVKNTNLSIQIMLLSIEEHLQYCDDNSLQRPSTYYHNMDGGPENATKLTLAVLALLVASGLFEKVECQRLPTNHHHEDVDAAFGKVAEDIARTNIMTVSEFVRTVNNSTKCLSKVVFIDVVPDFEVAMSGCIDKKFARVFKQQQTHHLIN